jgi:hypothetical protein
MKTGAILIATIAALLLTAGLGGCGEGEETKTQSDTRPTDMQPADAPQADGQNGTTRPSADAGGECECQTRKAFDINYLLVAPRTRESEKVRGGPLKLQAGDQTTRMLTFAIAASEQSAACEQRVVAQLLRRVNGTETEVDYQELRHDFATSKLSMRPFALPTDEPGLYEMRVNVYCDSRRVFEDALEIVIDKPQ